MIDDRVRGGRIFKPKRLDKLICPRLSPFVEEDWTKQATEIGDHHVN